MASDIPVLSDQLQTVPWLFFFFFFFSVCKGKPQGQILLVILQCWSWDHRGNSSQEGMGSSPALPRCWCKSSQPRLSRASANSQPGEPNCYVPTAVVIAIWQHPGCCTRVGSGRGRRWWAPLRNVTPERTEGWIYCGQWSLSWKETQGFKTRGDAL